MNRLLPSTRAIVMTLLAGFLLPVLFFSSPVFANAPWNDSVYGDTREDWRDYPQSSLDDGFLKEQRQIIKKTLLVKEIVERSKFLFSRDHIDLNNEGIEDYELIFRSTYKTFDLIKNLAGMIQGLASKPWTRISLQKILPFYDEPSFSYHEDQSALSVALVESHEFLINQQNKDSEFRPLYRPWDRNNDGNITGMERFRLVNHFNKPIQEFYLALYRHSGIQVNHAGSPRSPSSFPFPIKTVKPEVDATDVLAVALRKQYYRDFSKQLSQFLKYADRNENSRIDGKAEQQRLLDQMKSQLKNYKNYRSIVQERDNSQIFNPDPETIIRSINDRIEDTTIKQEDFHKTSLEKREQSTSQKNSTNTRTIDRENP